MPYTRTYTPPPTVQVDERMKAAALDFARQIILSDNQYSRLLPAEVRQSNDVTMQQKIEIQRTYMGKLGELAFAKFLFERGKAFDMTGMLEVYDGQNNVDSFDFATAGSKSVDIKTGFRVIHKRLLVNTQQFDSIPKDYYVAVKLNAADTDSRAKLVDWDSVTEATICGYAEYTYMKDHAQVYDYGEGPARWLFYDRLLNIDRLLNQFAPA